MLAFLVPVLTQFQRENYLEGTVLAWAKSSLCIYVPLRRSEEDGNYYRALTVNGGLSAWSLPIYLYSGISTYIWAQSVLTKTCTSKNFLRGKDQRSEFDYEKG